MATFSAQVSALSGTVTSETEVTTWIQDGIKDVIRRLQVLGSPLMHRFAQSINVGTSGLALNGTAIIVDIQRGEYECKEIPPSMRYRAGRSTSLHRATTQYPQFYRLDKTLVVLPQPSSATNAKASVIVPATTASTSSDITNFPNELEYLVVIYAALQNLLGKISDLALPADLTMPALPIITSFSDVATSLPTYTAVSPVVLPNSPSGADIDFSGIGSTPTYSSPTIIVLPTLALGADLTISAFTQTATAPTAPVIEITDGAVASFGTAPTFTAPVLALSDAESLDSLTLPASPPTLAVSASIEATLPDAPAISATDAEVGIFLEKTLSFTSTPPVYTAPTASIDGTVWATAYPNYATEIATALAAITTELAETQDVCDLINTQVDSAVTEISEAATAVDADVDTALAAIVTAVGRINTAVALANTQFDSAVTQTAAEDPELAVTYVGDGNGYLGEAAMSAKEASAYAEEVSARIQQVGGYGTVVDGYIKAAQGYAAEVSSKIAIAQGYTTEVNARLANVPAKVSEYRAGIENALQVFNDANVEYQAELQRSIENARMAVQNELAKSQATTNLNLQNEAQTMAAAVKDYQFELERYGGAVQAYAAEVNDEIKEYDAKLQKYQIDVTGAIQKFNSEQISGKQAKWIAQRQTEIAKYQADIQIAMQNFNKLNVEYQATIQEKLTEASNLLASETEENRLKIQKYNNELQQYQIDVNTEVQEYLQKDVQAELAEWTEKRRNLVAEFQTKSQSVIQVFAQELAEATQEFDSELKNWQTLIEKAVKTYTAETGYDLGLFTSDAQMTIAKHAEDVKNENTEFQANLGKYLGELQKVSEVNQRLLNKYSAEIGAFGAEVNSTIGQFNALLQKRQVNYTWYVDQYGRLRQQYESGFVPFEIKGDK